MIMDKPNPWPIDAALALIVAISAGAVLLAGNAAAQPNQSQRPDSGAADFIKPVSSQDHIRGNPQAPVKIVEFSDTECPLCKRFQPTMKKIVDEYGKSGKVAWVYRHFPIDEIHPKARKEAEATECANELGGDAKFWAYLDRIFEITPSNNNLDPAQLPRIAEDVGLNRAQFEQCLNSGRYAQHVAADLADALDSGGQGTPYSIVIAPNGKKFVIAGAQPYAVVKLVIDIALREKSP